MKRAILHVATDLGLRPTGVRELGDVLLGLGLAEAIGATVVERLDAPPFEPARDPVSGARNVGAVAALARRQADVLTRMLDRGEFPVVLGGDDSVLFGSLLAVRRRGSCGLVLIDAHTDFWDPVNGTGELSDSDLFITAGGGPNELADLEGLRPLVPARACVVYGHRDRADQLRDDSDDVYRQPMLVRNLGELRAAGMTDAAHHALAVLRDQQLDRVWLHLDADCLDDALMPAVDWRVAGGLAPDELTELLGVLLASELIAGMDVTIYNPALDSAERAAGRVLYEALTAAMGATISATKPRR